MSNRVLSQDEIDNVFRNLRENDADDDPSKRATPYDFRRPDRIAKDQLRSIHLLHENFGRSLASSLSAYLRAYVVANLVSVEQLSFAEFARCLPASTCIVSLGLRPYEGNGILEMSHSLVFPIFEMLLGGTGKRSSQMDREITEIEKSILDDVFRIVLQDLKTAWQAVTFIDFVIDAYETDPQLLQVLSPNEAVVAVSMELRVGEHNGIMNIGIPSIIIKMLRQKFDHQWMVRKSQSTDSEHARILRLIKPALVNGEVRLNGPQMLLEDLMKIDVGDVLTFDHPLDKEVHLFLNGMVKFAGNVISSGTKRGFHLKQEYKQLE